MKIFGAMTRLEFKYKPDQIRQIYKKKSHGVAISRDAMSSSLTNQDDV